MALGTTAIIGLASTAASIGGAGANFIQASKQMKLQRQAEQDASKAYEEAKRQINVNPWDALGIPKEAYELEKEAFLAQGAQAIAAGQEGDRGAAATVGRIQMAKNEQQAGVRTAMSKEMQDMAKLSATEDTNIKDTLAGLSLSQAQGYQTQAKEAKDARAKLIESGVKGITEGVKTGVETFMPLYLKQAGRDPLTGEKLTTQAQNNMDKIGMPTATPSANVGKDLTAGLNLSRVPNAGVANSQSIFAEDKLLRDSNYFNQGTKFGNPMRTPNWMDAYNYLNPLNQ